MYFTRPLFFCLKILTIIQGEDKMITARSLLGLSLLETNLETGKDRIEALKEIIRKQNKALKEILNEHKSENEDKVQADSKVEEVPIKTEEGKKGRRRNRKVTS